MTPEERAKLIVEMRREPSAMDSWYLPVDLRALIVSEIREAVAEELRHQAGDGLRGLFPSYVSAICMGDTVSLNEVARWLNDRADEITQGAGYFFSPGAGGAVAKATAEPSNPETCGRHRS